MPTSSVARAGTIVARVALTAVLLWLVIVLGQIPWGQSGNEAVLRLALRTVKGRVEICTERSAEELAEVPAHMRGSGTVCDSHPVNYRLRVAVDGVEVANEIVEPGGLRRDRPHNIDHEIVVAPGTAAIEIVFSPERPDEVTEETLAAMRNLPVYELRRDVDFVADRITLVFLNDSTGELDLES